MTDIGKFKKILLIGLFIFLINLMNVEVGYFLTIYDSIIMDYRIERGMIGWIIFGFFIGEGSSTLIFGYYSDKYSRQKLFFLGTILFSLFCIIVFLNDFTKNFTILLIFRSLLSIGLGCSMPIGISMMIDLIPSKSRSKIFAIFLIGTFAGGIVGFALGFTPNFLQSIIIIIFGFNVTWEYPYLFFGIAGLIGGSILLLFKEPKRAATEEEFIDLISSGKVYSYKIKIEDLKKIYERPSNFWLVINFVDTIAPGLLLNWIIYYIQQAITYNKTTYIEVGISALIILGGFLFGTFYFAKIGDQGIKLIKHLEQKLQLIARYLMFHLLLFVLYSHYLVFLFRFSFQSDWQSMEALDPIGIQHL